MKTILDEKEYCVDFCSIFIYAKDDDEARRKAIEFIDNREVSIDQIFPSESSEVEREAEIETTMGWDLKKE